MTDRLVTSRATDEEQGLENILRPQTLDEYVGQEKVKESLRICIEAAKQSGRVQPLKIEFVTEVPPVPTNSYFFHTQGKVQSWSDLPTHLTEVNLWLGPEGGFETGEVPTTNVLSLGPRVLRAETAAIAAITLMAHRLGDLS